ncbi:MAG: tRNA (adenosine(37)-N6)-threonylcarbamoyltransferase complex transferase subunit TsaD [Elusimicrobiota bacterium]
MHFIAIETSCDETSVALFRNNTIVSHYVYSQIEAHKKYCGVVPEIASREHSKKIYELISKLKIKKLDAVGFTKGPGLKGSLLVGKIAALTLSRYFKTKIIGVNHLEGHLLSTEIEGKRVIKKLKFPLIALIVSGGHTELWYVKDYGVYSLIGKTRDDACGEAFDKVARILGLGYPGGPKIEKIAEKSKFSNIKFTVPYIKNSFEYSFSGIKTQIAYYVKGLKSITVAQKSEIAAAFQKSVFESLINKLDEAVKKFGVCNIVVCGGVSVNSFLRERLMDRFGNTGINIFLPDKEYTSDNAAMIGVAVLRRLDKGKYKNNIQIDSSLKISGWI